MQLEEIKETFAFLDDWEDRYRFIIDLGKELEGLPETDRSEENLVRGCQSQVWLLVNLNPDGQLVLQMDSDAHIVRGLIAIVLAALNQQTPERVLAFNMDELFNELELLQHLSPTRGNGLMAMLQRIQAAATEYSQ